MLRATKEGVIIEIAVTPNAKKERIKGYDPWRMRLMVDMKEKPEKFKVNRELVRFFATLLNIPPEKVRIVGGEKSTLKSILIVGGKEDELRKILSRYL